MTHPIKYLALVVSSLALVACGGGGGGGTTVSGATAPIISDTSGTSDTAVTPDTSVASAALAKYEGVWQQACVDHMRLTTTLKATSANIFTVTPIETYFANANCTGDVVAIGSYGVPSEIVDYFDPVNAAITLKDGSAITADVNPATSSIATATFALTGSGVKPSYNFGGTIMTPIQYADEILPRLYPARALTGGTTQGALLLRNEELLTLVPVAGVPNSYTVKLQFFR